MPADGVAAAGEAALKQARKLYGTAKDYRGLRIVQATWAPREPTRGRYARVKCGSTISKRTVVVALEFPREQGASLKEGVVLVSSTASGYEAWTVLH